MSRAIRKLEGGCTIDGCDRERLYVKTGWCRTHYHRWYRTGSPHEVKQERGASGSSTASWQGEDISYYGVHNRAKSLWGSASQYPCIECGDAASEWAYDGLDPTEMTEQVCGKPARYSAWPEFYMPMCVGCHRFRDRRARQRTHCSKGHELTAENTYVTTRPTKDGRRVVENRYCRACKKADSRARYLKRKSAVVDG